MVLYSEGVKEGEDGKGGLRWLGRAQMVSDGMDNQGGGRLLQALPIVIQGESVQVGENFLADGNCDRDDDDFPQDMVKRRRNLGGFTYVPLSFLALLNLLKGKSRLQ